MQIYLYEPTPGTSGPLATFCRARGLEPLPYNGEAAGPMARPVTPRGGRLFFIDTRCARGAALAAGLAASGAPTDFLCCLTGPGEPPPCLCLAALCPTLPGYASGVGQVTRTAARLASTAARQPVRGVPFADILWLREESPGQLCLHLPGGNIHQLRGAPTALFKQGKGCFFAYSRSCAVNLLQAAKIEINTKKIYLKNGKILLFYARQTTQKAALITQGGYIKL